MKNIDSDATKMTIASAGVTIRTNLSVSGNQSFVVATQLVATNSTANSNLVMNVDIGALTLYATNNISVTNFAGLAVGKGATITWWIYPQLVNRTLVLPTLNTPNLGVLIRTNANSPIYPTLTNGNMYALSLEWRNTNATISLSQW